MFESCAWLYLLMKFLPEVCKFFLKETLIEMFFCEFWKKLEYRGTYLLKVSKVYNRTL